MITRSLFAPQGPNIREGPEALAQLFSQAKQGTPTQPHASEQRGTDQQPSMSCLSASSVSTHVACAQENKAMFMQLD